MSRGWRCRRFIGRSGCIQRNRRGCAEQAIAFSMVQVSNHVGFVDTSSLPSVPLVIDTVRWRGTKRRQTSNGTSPVVDYRHTIKR